MPQFDFDYKDNSVTHPPSAYPNNGELTNNDFRHSVVHSREYDASSLLTTISGFSYNVDYYSQILGSADEPRPFDPDQQTAFQQYQKIVNYELKLQDSISQAYDPVDNRLSATGSALTYPYLKPNVGDAFIGDIGDGKAGLFTVTEALKKTRFKQTTYEIQFELSYILDKDTLNTIDERTVKTSYFVKDYIRFGMDPVLTDERYQAGGLLSDTIKDMLTEYLSEFFSYEYSTLLVPSNNKGIYDPFVVKSILTIFDVSDHPTLSKISQMNVDDSQFNKYLDIWTMMMTQQINLIDNVFSQIQLLPARSFSRNALLQTVAFSGIDLIVLPVTRNKSVDDILELSRVRPNAYNVEVGTDSIRTPIGPGGEGLKSIPDVENSPQYIFTTGFYNDMEIGEDQSDFENLIKRYLNKEHLDYREMLEFAGSRNYWTPFERFYLLPMLLILMIYQQRSI